MKRIIYSFVMVLLAGSIFTSCIENVEPAGVQKMRDAHAQYLLACASLKQADAKVSEADAAFINAQAAVQQAIAAQEQARAEMLRLQNELLDATNQAQIDEINLELELLEAEMGAEIADAQAALAIAQKNLADQLASLQLDQLRLSQEEEASLNYIRMRYAAAADRLTALYNQQTEGGDFDEFLEDLYVGPDYSATQDNMVEILQSEIADYELQLTYAERTVNFWRELKEGYVTDFVAEIESYKDSSYGFELRYKELEADSVRYLNTDHKEIWDKLQSDIDAADEAYDDAVKQPTKDFTAATKDLKGYELKTVLEKEVAVAKAVPYVFNGGFQIPAHNAANDIIGYYETYRWDSFINYHDSVQFVPSNNFKKDSLYINTRSFAKKADYEKFVDSLWEGAQTSQLSQNMTIGIRTAYDDFERDYLYDPNHTIDLLAANKDAIEDYRDSLVNAYDSILAILEAAPAQNADKLLQAWYDEVEENIEGLDELIELVQAAGHDNYYPVGGGDSIPRLISHTYPQTVSSITSGGVTTYLLEDDSTFIYPGNGLNVTMAVSAQDSLDVFNNIKTFFQKIAAVDPSKVPFLRFVSSTNGIQFNVDSIRMDQINFESIELQTTNTYLASRGVLKSALYDNKGIYDLELEPDGENYLDAFGNVLNVFRAYVHGWSLNNFPYNGEEYDDYANLSDGWDALVAYYNANHSSEVGDDYVWNLSNSSVMNMPAPALKTFAKLSVPGQAFINWISAAKTYYGTADSTGLAKLAENVYFKTTTFTEVTNAVIFSKFPTLANFRVVPSAWEDISSESPVVFTQQFGFIAASIMSNLATDNYNLAAFTDLLDGNYNAFNIIANSLPFKVLWAEYALELANNPSSFFEDEAWEALGILLDETIQPALYDDLFAAVDAEKAANEAAAAAYNAAKAIFDAATAEATEVRDDAIEAAEDEYDAAREAVLGPIIDEMQEIEARIGYYHNLIEALSDVYFMNIPGNYEADMQASIKFMHDRYMDAQERVMDIEEEIADWKFMLEQVQGTAELSDEELLALVTELQQSADEYNKAEIADALAWYEYWKAAYEQALAIATSKPAPTE